MTQSQKDLHAAVALWAVGVMVMLIIIWGISEALALLQTEIDQDAPRAILTILLRRLV